MAHANEIEILSSIHQVSASEWDALDHGDFPFSDHAFLRLLEDSGSVGERTGWFPHHIVVKQSGRVVGACPCYVKNNSYGEYIFDWAWARGAEESGIEYYPKLVVAIPFTPATGARFLLPRHSHESRTVDSSAESREPLARRAVLQQLISALHELERSSGASSTHILFSTDDESSELTRAGFMRRHSFQYHWRNQGWSSFDDFLQAFKSKRRREIRHEREHARELPIDIKILSGESLRAYHEDYAQAMYRFYRSTTDKMGGYSYLTRDFFLQSFRDMSDSIVFALASDRASGSPVAGALFFARGVRLFGRYWGCLEEYKHLHFELCYYQAIDWALANGIELFEAGAQGEHKHARGFLPSLTLSSHHIANPDLARAVGHFIDQERRKVDELLATSRAPFRTGETAGSSFD